MSGTAKHITMPSNLHIRAASRSDLPIIAALATQVFLDTYATDGVRLDLAEEAFSEYGREKFAKRFAEPQRTFILAERDAGVVGFAELLLQPLPAPNSEIVGSELIRLYIQPKAQRLGIGAALLKRSEALAEQAGLPAVWLTAWDGNAQALAFYAAQGYTVVGTTIYTFQGQSYGNQVLAKRLRAATREG